MRTFSWPKAVLLLFLGILLLVYALLREESSRHSLTRIVDAFLISPSFVGMLLLLLYQFYTVDVLKTVARTCLTASLVLYVFFIGFGLYMLTQPHTISNTTYTFYLFLVPLALNILVLTGLNRFLTTKPLP